jgi:hypothetical protein
MEVLAPYIWPKWDIPPPPIRNLFGLEIKAVVESFIVGERV